MFTHVFLGQKKIMLLFIKKVPWKQNLLLYLPLHPILDPFLDPLLDPLSIWAASTNEVVFSLAY